MKQVVVSEDVRRVALRTLIELAMTPGDQAELAEDEEQALDLLDSAHSIPTALRETGITEDRLTLACMRCCRSPRQT